MKKSILKEPENHDFALNNPNRYEQVDEKSSISLVSSNISFDKFERNINSLKIVSLLCE